MTKKQAQQFNRMRFALREIARGYQTPAMLRRNSEKEYGIGYEEALEMSYENLQAAAAAVIKGVKEVSVPQKKTGKTAPATDTGK